MSEEETTKEVKKMTVFYKKKDLALHAICDGKQNYSFFGDLEASEAELIYGYFYIDSDKFILRNKKGFIITKDKDGNLNLEMTEEYKKIIKKYIEE